MTLQEALRQPDVVEAVRTVLHYADGATYRDDSIRTMMLLTAVEGMREAIESKGCIVPEYTA